MLHDARRLLELLERADSAPDVMAKLKLALSDAAEHATIVIKVRCRSTDKSMCAPNVR